MRACTLLVRCGCAGGGKGALVSDEVSLTLSTNNTQTLFSEEGGDMVVRRLTPCECERLQGFPSDWTKIPYRGKPAEECPDGPRYKAVGNSMAVPVMRWIGERIAMAEAGGRTYLNPFFTCYPREFWKDNKKRVGEVCEKCRDEVDGDNVRRRNAKGCDAS